MRFRVEEEHWHDQAPTKPGNEELETKKMSPYMLTASMEDSGMGPCLWWDGDDEEGDEEMAE